jgi:NAD(P)-dependent dehydrogenase (short-subunit alcohol dehydrogenase family)
MQLYVSLSIPNDQIYNFFREFMTLASKTILIFGGIGGIGGALAERLAAKGGTPYVTTRNPAAGQTTLPPEQILTADALDHDSIRAAVTKTGQNGLHGLVYAIGSIDLKPFSRTTADDLLKSYQLNVVGAFIAMQAAAPLLAQSGGSVVLFSSVAAQRGFSNHVAIATAKAAIEGLAKSAAAELAPKVRVNVIAPSLTDTPLAKGMTQNPKIAETIAAMHPLPRLGDAGETAALAEFLLSDDAGWITGQVFHIDGGRSTLERK